MYFIKEKQANGDVVYRFRYRDPLTRKLRRLPVADTPHVKSDKEAKNFCLKWKLKHDAAKQRFKDRKAWEKDNLKFSELGLAYEEFIKKRAPNSWDAQMNYLHHYVLYYFITLRQIPNVNLWSDHFLEFRNWLEEHAKSARTGRKISYASMNHCVTVLNNFLKLMFLKNLASPSPKCDRFPDHLEGSRGVDDIIYKEEFEWVKSRLLELDEGELYNDFYHCLYKTGMRLSELTGISLYDFHGKKEIPKEALQREIEGHDLKVCGYIVLTSQAPEGRDIDGNVPRKPLKARKKIDAKSGRIVPIFEPSTFNILVKRRQIAKEEFEAKRYGNDPKDYLLFDGINKNKLSGKLKTVYRNSGRKYKSPHCCRHSMATNLAGETLSYTLAKMILGQSERVFQKYCHLFEEITRKAEAQVQLEEDFELMDE